MHNAFISSSNTKITIDKHLKNVSFPSYVHIYFLFRLWVYKVRSFILTFLQCIIMYFDHIYVILLSIAFLLFFSLWYTQTVSCSLEKCLQRYKAAYQYCGNLEHTPVDSTQELLCPAVHCVYSASRFCVLSSSCRIHQFRASSYYYPTRNVKDLRAFQGPQSTCGRIISHVRLLCRQKTILILTLLIKARVHSIQSLWSNPHLTFQVFSSILVLWLLLQLHCAIYYWFPYVPSKLWLVSLNQKSSPSLNDPILGVGFDKRMQLIDSNCFLARKIQNEGGNTREVFCKKTL